MFSLRLRAMLACTRRSLGRRRAPTARPAHSNRLKYGLSDNFDVQTFVVLQAGFECLPCNNGTYSTQPAQSICLLCDTGRAQPLLGQTGCTGACFDSIANTHTVRLQTACLAPSKARRLRARVSLHAVVQIGRAACRVCRVRRAPTCQARTAARAWTGLLTSLVDTRHRNSAVHSPVGEFIAHTGATNCTQCGIGHYNAVPHASVCSKWCDCLGILSAFSIACLHFRSDMGSYTTGIGQTACQLCPAGRSGNDTGLTRCCATLLSGFLAF